MVRKNSVECQCFFTYAHEPVRQDRRWILQTCDLDLLGLPLLSSGPMFFGSPLRAREIEAGTATSLVVAVRNFVWSEMGKGLFVFAGCEHAMPEDRHPVAGDGAMEMLMPPQRIE